MSLSTKVLSRTSAPGGAGLTGRVLGNSSSLYRNHLLELSDKYNVDGHLQWRRVIAVLSAATYTYGKGDESGHLMEYPKKERRLADGSFDYSNSGLPKLNFGCVVISQASEVLLV